MLGFLHVSCIVAVRIPGCLVIFFGIQKNAVNCEMVREACISWPILKVHDVLLASVQIVVVLDKPLEHDPHAEPHVLMDGFHPKVHC